MQSHQSVVDEMFRSCMRKDIRYRDEIVRQISPWVPKPDSQLRIMVSRMATRAESRGAEPQYYAVHATPRRYVSVARVRELAERNATGLATAEERELLRSMLADVKLARAHVGKVMARQRRRWEHLEDLVRAVEAPQYDALDAAELGAVI